MMRFGKAHRLGHMWETVCIQNEAPTIDTSFRMIVLIFAIRALVRWRLKERGKPRLA